ncbi:MAG: multiprotein bridging factor aMBF1 [Candidatus Woesearchaeota archaeon]
MQCELCGSEIEAPISVDVDGALLGVCGKCSRFGKVIKHARVIAPARPVPKKIVPAEPEFVVVADYAKRIRNKREEMGLKQEDFAKLIHQRESLLGKLENGSFEPSIDMCKKLENILSIKLIEEYKEEKMAVADAKDSSMTIGDMIKVKRR